jgi:hypothetical protein
MHELPPTTHRPCLRPLTGGPPTDFARAHPCPTLPTRARRRLPLRVVSSAPQRLTPLWPPVQHSRRPTHPGSDERQRKDGERDRMTSGVAYLLKYHFWDGLSKFGSTSGVAFLLGCSKGM